MESLYCLCHITQNVLIQRLILIELWYEAEKSGQSDGWKKDYLSPADLRQGEKAGACHDGWIVSIPSNPGQLSVRRSICCHVTF